MNCFIRFGVVMSVLLIVDMSIVIETADETVRNNVIRELVVGRKYDMRNSLAAITIWIAVSLRKVCNDTVRRYFSCIRFSMKRARLKSWYTLTNTTSNRIILGS